MPAVSIIVPCYNEEATIKLLLQAIAQQDFPCADMEVIVADAMSTDRTREEIAAFQKECPHLKVKVVDNPKQTIPSALNYALQAAQGTYIVRLDAHSVPIREYVSRCMADLQAGRGDNVGGVWEIEPGSSHWVAKSIALAAAHPLGAGDAKYRIGARAGEVDTVPFGAYCRQTAERLGGYNEDLLANEDYEFNVRLRQQGGRVWLNPEIRSTYFARPTLGALARQYWRYGFWKQRMLRAYPKTLRWRQALPPLFVAGVVFLLLLSFSSALARILLLLLVLCYGLVLLGASVPLALRQRQAYLLIGVPVAIMTMHFAWGGGFWWSLISSLVRR
ncbi:MAG: glycosyltransferase family 2 protein [Anaerolineae bacterium]|nr:glycosyltransferase family 2 protein [Anaerolineae bacterium]